MFIAQCWIGKKPKSGNYNLFRILLLLGFVRFVEFAFPFEFFLFLLFDDLLLLFLVSLLASSAFRMAFGLALDVDFFCFDVELLLFVFVLFFDLFGVEARVFFSPLESFFTLLLLLLLLLFLATGFEIV